MTVTVAGPSVVRVGVYDALGRRAAVVHDGPLATGAHRLGLDVSGWAPGVYAVRAEGVGASVTRRLVVAR